MYLIGIIMEYNIINFINNILNKLTNFPPKANYTQPIKQVAYFLCGNILKMMKFVNERDETAGVVIKTAEILKESKIR